jgi:hypothetical protein
LGGYLHVSPGFLKEIRDFVFSGAIERRRVRDHVLELLRVVGNANLARTAHLGLLRRSFLRIPFLTEMDVNAHHGYGYHQPGRHEPANAYGAAPNVLTRAVLEIAKETFNEIANV